MTCLCGKCTHKAEERTYVARLLATLGLGLLVAFLCNCTPGAAASALDAISRGAQWLGTVLDVAHAGAEAFSARHPNQDRENEIAAAERDARRALLALESASEGDYGPKKAEAVRAYARLKALLDDSGVTDARSPAGGAEAEAPAPEPVPLPSADEVAARLGS